MNLDIKDQLFLVCGASSGFGKAVAERLALEGGKIIAVARGEEKLKELQQKHPGHIETVPCDITKPEAIKKLLTIIGNRQLHGTLINAGGPPAMTVLEPKLQDCDEAYTLVFRWKM